MIKEGDTIIAKCPLSLVENEENSIHFTPFWLHVNQRKKKWRFENENVKAIHFSHHKFLGALILGGILSSFSVVALSAWTFDPYLLLTAFVLGLMLLYYGFSGSPAIEIIEVNDRTVIYVKEITQPLKEFVVFYRNYLRSNNDVMEIFHIAEDQEWAKDPNYYEHTSLKLEGFIHASVKEQVLPTYDKYFNEGASLFLLRIAMTKLESKVKYEYVESRNTSFPHIYGKLNKSAVVEAIPFESRDELKKSLQKLSIKG